MAPPARAESERNIRSGSDQKYPVRRSAFMSLLLKRNGRLCAEPLIAQISDAEALPLRSCAEIQGVLSVGEVRKPVLPVNRLAERCEAGKQILGFRRADLRHGLSLGAHYAVILLIYPQQSIKEALALQDLARPHFEHPAIDGVHVFFTAKPDLIVPELLFSENEGLYVPYVGKVLRSHNQPFECVDGLPHHSFDAFMLR